MAGVGPQPPAPLADPPAGRGEPAPDARQIPGAEPGPLHDHGVLVGKRNQEPALLDPDPCGWRQTSSQDAADVGDQVRTVDDVAEPGLAMAQGQRTQAGIDQGDDRFVLRPRGSGEIRQQMYLVVLMEWSGRQDGDASVPDAGPATS